MNKIYLPLNKPGGNKHEEYSSLNGLRAIAAVGIVIMHVQANITHKPEMGYLSVPIISSFGMFVLLFMIISAFSMCCGYYDRIKNQKISPNDFYKRRICRIFPFFALMSFIDIIVEHNISSLYEGFSNLTLFFNFYQREIKVIGVGWFIGIICVFYMLFPVFVALMDNKKRAIIVTISSIALTYIAENYFCINNRENFSLYFPFFSVGGLMYLFRKEIIKNVSKSYHLFALICVIVTIAYFLIGFAGNFAIRMSQLLLFTLWTCFAISKNNFLLTNKVMNFISGISMEVYLCHMMVFRIVQKTHLEEMTFNQNLNFIFACVFTLGGAIIFSYIVKYKFINKIIFHK